MFLHAEYERAFFHEEGQGLWDYRTPGFDWQKPGRESRANRIALIVATCLEKGVYSEGEEEVRHQDTHLLWVHNQRCAIDAMRAREYGDAIIFAGTAVVLAKMINETQPATQLIWLLANQKDAEAEAMIRALNPRSHERRQLEAARAASKAQKH